MKQERRSQHPLKPVVSCAWTNNLIHVLVTLLLAFSVYTFLMITTSTVCLIPSAAAADASSESLYQILGVPKKATTQEIKRAYRKKALDTHPDKNPGVPAEEAAQKFHKVVQAFEVLSDPTSRRRYDQTGSTSTASANQGGGGFQWNFQRGGGGGGAGGSSFHFHFGGGFYRQTQRMKDKPAVKQAQARLMHIVSWAQFQTVLMEDDDDNDVLERHVLIAAVNPSLEEHVMDTMVFPYPFAGMSPQSIWWEDVLQTVLIRYHSQNELTQKLQLPKGQDLTTPVFLLGRKGQSIHDIANWARFETNSRGEFEKWVWQQMQVQLYFENYHDHDVEIHWIDGTRAHLKVKQLRPGQREEHLSHLTHEWYIRDTRTDSRPDSPGRYKLTKQSSLLHLTILNATSPQRIIIPKRECYDFSGHCPFWVYQGECTKNPNFMKEQCSLSCQYCDDTQDQIWVEQAKNGSYVPPTAFPEKQQQSVGEEQHHEEPEPEQVHDEL